MSCRSACNTNNRQPMKRTALTAACAAFVLNLHPAAAAPLDLVVLQQQAHAGDAHAQTELATRYENAEGVPRDFGRANVWLCKAARQGYAEAQYQLAWSYAYGRGEQRDDATAAALFRLAADQGHRYAQRALQWFGSEPAKGLPACMQPDPPVREAAAATDDAVPREAESPLPKAPPEIVRLVRRLAPAYDVDARLVLAVISVESAFKASAVSPKNAQGLMQLIPETAQRFGVKRLTNPADNIKGGLAYLRWLLAFFEGDVPLVLAAYNAGEGAVEKYRGIPPYAETRNYVKRITALYGKATHPYIASVTSPSTMLALKRETR